MIALIGFTGAGKSTLGASLHVQLDIPCYDVDVMLEEQQKMKIADMFATFGEAAFRELEAGAIRSLSGCEAGVIVTGGGAVLNADTRRWLNRHCLVVHVRTPIEVIARRMGSMQDRPLLAGDDPERVLRTLYEARQGVYDFAHLEVDGTDIEVASAVISDAWRKWRHAQS